MHHLAGPEGSFAASERERGWREALGAAGVVPEPAVRGDWSAESGYAVADRFEHATAVFSANDQMALGLIRGLAERGRDVPGEVSVIGFDDVPDAANYRPPLTTIRQDFAALAHRAVEALVADIEQGSTPPPLLEVLPTQLVERGSAGSRALED